LTEALAIRHGRPFLHIDFELIDKKQAVVVVEQWVCSMAFKVINVAGPRASSDPRIYQAVYSLLTEIRWPTQPFD